MIKYCYVFVFLMSVAFADAQELNCSIKINSEQLSGTNKQIFATLEATLNEFVNNKQWTTKSYKKQERVECGMTFIISSQNSNSFTGTLQITALRPVYGSSYKTPIFNFKDSDIVFNYVEFEPLVYNSTTFESNLVSIVSFYVYVILGIDADTFSPMGGEDFYKQAMEIATLAQQGNYEGWAAKRNRLNRYGLIDQMLIAGHKEYREVLYAYHRKGFDNFSTDKTTAKTALLEGLLLFDKLYNRHKNTFLIRTFLDAKADEIVQVFKDGPSLDTSKLISVLSRVSAGNISKWKQFK